MERRHALRDDQWTKIKDALSGKEGDKDEQRLTTDYLSTLLCGSQRQMRLGEICQKAMKNGQAYTNGLSGGQKMVYGK